MIVMKASAGSVLAAIVFFAPASATAAQVSAALSQKAPDAAEMVATAQAKGFVRVIVRFQSPVAANEIRPDAASIAAVSAKIAAVQDTIIAAHFGSATSPVAGAGFSRGISRFTMTPGFAVNVTRAELEALAADPLVSMINYDRAMPPLLLQSVPPVGMAVAASQPTGSWPSARDRPTVASN